MGKQSQNITIAMASLGGVRFPRWFMLSAQVVYTLVFTSLTHVNIRDGNLYLPQRIQRALTAAVDADLDLIAVTIWLLVLALAVVLKYGPALLI